MIRKPQAHAGAAMQSGWPAFGAGSNPAAALAVAALLIAGCAQAPLRTPQAPPAPQATPRPAPPPVNLSGYSAAFREGFQVGCDMARGGAARPDENRLRSDTQYAQGWQDGRSICARR
jgi:hypothetical protein